MRERKTLWGFESLSNATIGVGARTAFIFCNSRNDANAIWAQGIFDNKGLNTIFTKMNDENMTQAEFLIKSGDIVAWVKQAKVIGYKLSDIPMEGLSQEVEDEFRIYCLENNIKFIDVTNVTTLDDIENNI